MNEAPTSAHTPLPWRYTRSFGTIEIVPNGTQQPLAGMDFDAEEDRANAAFIVRACNSHYALLSVVQDMFENPQFQVAIGGNPIMVEALIARARAALSQAGGASD